MKERLLILICIIAVLSCGNDRKQTYSPTIESDTLEEQYQPIDSPIVKEVLEVKKPVKSADVPSSSAPTRSQSSQHNDDDNMRGFDPASEDDMEDNGMSRYMENNDEEGWD